MIENPKMAGSNLIDCVPQVGRCPNNCDQCYYNKWFYAGFEPVIPTAEDAEGKIVRVNSGNDSNNQRELVLEATRGYKHRFYNTSIPKFDFEDCPVVLTINPRQDGDWVAVALRDNLMFVFFRMNTWNVDMAKEAIRHYCFDIGVPVVLTFMRYFDLLSVHEPHHYEPRKHVLHEYWDITEKAWWMVMSELPLSNLLFTCGTPGHPYCRDCGVCETLYWRQLVLEGRIEEIEGGLESA